MVEPFSIHKYNTTHITTEQNNQPTEAKKCIKLFVQNRENEKIYIQPTATTITAPAQSIQKNEQNAFRVECRQNSMLENFQVCYTLSFTQKCYSYRHAPPISKSKT